ncbi:hypothetical protein BLA60_06930 [Actinophytocola xinjiangensis]|uniref:Uncharacterized protein n=1 Tax=Actinophytocola xinjiangensis TaxID=485602 RepID=A0A7Z0WQC7_9PSEU|nr:hypothetical protein BLA60_06930 [Actinophytocola xinjiangensis]
MSTLDILRRLVAERMELPVESVGATTLPRDDLHLGPITVGRIATETARLLGRPLPATTNLATVTLGELAGIIDGLPVTGPWAPTALGGHLERALETILGGTRAVAVEPDPVDAVGPAGRRAQTDLAASRALGRPVRVRHRPDGKPEIDGASVSASHCAGLTLVVVTGTGRLGCDLETVVERDRLTWAGLLGRDQLPVRDLLTVEAGESESTAGTRVWCALECLRKTGSTTQALTLDRVEQNGWAVLSAGDARIATWVTTVNDVPDPVVVAVLSGEE